MNLSEEVLLPIHTPVPQPARVRTLTHDGIFITCYENAVPPFVEAELERLYGNIYSSLKEITIYRGGIEHASTYVVHKGLELTSLLLFQRSGRKVQVLNEGIRISAGELHRFADYIFTTYASVDVISVHAVKSEVHLLRFPKQCFNCLEDIILRLPDSVEAYRASLGKATRSYINRYQNKLKRTFPSFRHTIYAGQEIQEKHIRDIIRLNKARMAEKGKISDKDDKEMQRVIQLAKACGLVGVLEIDGKTCAGTINYRAGNNYFLDVISHDSEYNDYRLGTLCCYFTICECIARRGREYHFLWGQNDYKYRLGGVQHDLDHLAIYRSRKHLLLNSDLVLKNAAKRCERRFRRWVQDSQRRNSGILGLSIEWIHRLRRRKLHQVPQSEAEPHATKAASP